MSRWWQHKTVFANSTSHIERTFCPCILSFCPSLPPPFLLSFFLPFFLPSFLPFVFLSFTTKMWYLKPHATTVVWLFSGVQTAKDKLLSSWPQGLKGKVRTKKLKWICFPTSLFLKRQKKCQVAFLSHYVQLRVGKNALATLDVRTT